MCYRHAHNIYMPSSSSHNTDTENVTDQKSSVKQQRDCLENKERRQLQTNNVFPDLWEDAPLHLDPSRSSLLKSMDPDVIVHESTGVMCVIVSLLSDN